ncbi:MAG: phosphoribosyltransferase family protein, partial [Firmicutes bacterium]|nr:phosphoribosyltransferase family protein [Bacillota bacterium]
IPHASILADRFQLPTVYVRSEAKAHGQGRQIEGHFRSGMKAVVVEDTLSTGKSSYEAVRALQQAGVDVLAVLTILSYDFDVAMQKMRETGVPVYRLVSYHDLVRVAVAVGVIPETEVDLLMKWREAPDSFVAAQK